MSKDIETSQKNNILIVDDTPDNLRVLSSMLVNERGYHVRKALNGQIALIACEKTLPDLILLDINMPEMNGYELCTYLKQKEKTRDIPIIFISALDDVLDIIKAFHVGGSDYITKPFYVEEVLVRIENQLTIKRLQKQLKEQNNLLIEEIEKRREAEQALRTANEKLQHLASSDKLTGISNRRHLDEYLHREWLRGIQEQTCLSLIMCDIDYFKAYNDAYGHQAGDVCLQQIAQAIKSALKYPGDLVARYGGEEFVAILPNTSLEGAIKVAQNIQLEVQKLKIIHAQYPSSDLITLSLGISSKMPSLETSPESLIKDADTALYQAKKEGRDRYCIARN
ncbi:diguanylate cyclase response regulator [Oscillatoriales cyanobacterium USR001]|nr:diguanylate cyclase response regulator [Oscillatoriales cyanobacterium USR001]